MNLINKTLVLVILTALIAVPLVHAVSFLRNDAVVHVNKGGVPSMIYSDDGTLSNYFKVDNDDRHSAKRIITPGYNKEHFGSSRYYAREIVKVRGSKSYQLTDDNLARSGSWHIYRNAGGVRSRLLMTDEELAELHKGKIKTFECKSARRCLNPMFNEGSQEYKFRGRYYHVSRNLVEDEDYVAKVDL